MKKNFYISFIKEDSGNIRESMIPGVIKRIKTKSIGVAIYEPIIKKFDSCKSKLVDLDTLKSEADIINTNCIHVDLEDINFAFFSGNFYYEN